MRRVSASTTIFDGIEVPSASTATGAEISAMTAPEALSTRAPPSRRPASRAPAGSENVIC